MTDKPIDLLSQYCPSAVRAQYTPQRIPYFQGNCLVEALPPAMTDSQLYDSMTVLPDYSDVQRNWEGHERIQMLMQLMRMTVPSSRHIQLARAIDNMMRDGYRGRNPLAAGHSGRIQRLYEAKCKGSTDPMQLLNDKAMISSLLMGIPGMGKTTAVERAIRAYPKCLYHPDHHIYQVPCLHVDMPSDGSSVKGLAINIVAEINKLFPTERFSKEYITKSSNSIEILHNVGRLMSMFHVGLVLADEIENLANARRDKQTVMTDMVSLCNAANFPLLFIGTNKATDVFSLDFRQSRRAAGYGLDHWDRLQEFHPSNLEMSYVMGDGVLRSEWQNFLDILWTFQWTREPVDLNANLAHTMYQLSQGVVDIAIKLFIAAQKKAITERTERITTELLLDVYQNQMPTIHAKMKALRSNDPRNLIAYPDLRDIGLDDEISGALKSSRGTARRSQMKGNMQALINDVAEALIQAGVGIAEALAVARNAVVAGNASTLDEAVALAWESINGRPLTPAPKVNGKKRGRPRKAQDSQAEQSPAHTEAAPPEIGDTRPLEEVLDLS